MPHIEGGQHFRNSLGDAEDIDYNWKDRTNTSSPNEVEDGFVVVSDEPTAEWDGDQTRYVPPTPYQSAVQTAKQTCGLGLSYLQNTIDKAASVVAHVAEEALPTALAPRRRESSIMDITGWEPPKNAFDREVSEPKSSREVKLGVYRQRLALKARLKEKSGIQFAEENEAYDAMGVSTAWRKPEKREDDKIRKQRLLEEWKAKDERQKSQRGGVYGRELDDTTGTRDRASKRASQLQNQQARGESDEHGTRARMGTATSNGTAQKAAAPKEMGKTEEGEACKYIPAEEPTVNLGRQQNPRGTGGNNCREA